MPSRAGKNGGYTFGKFVKLFGNCDCYVAAIEDAFNTAYEFLPVRVFPLPLPIMLFVPEDLSLSLIILFGLLVDYDLASLPPCFLLSLLLLALELVLELVEEILL